MAGPVYLLVAPIVDTGIVRVTGRCLLITGFLLAPLVARQAGLTGLFGVDRAVSVLMRGLLVGAALGAISFLPHALLLLSSGVRVPGQAPGDSLIVLGAMLPGACATGLLVALVEESLFRGAVFTAARAAGASMAIAVSALLFALAHFLRPETPYPLTAPVHWYSGIQVIADGLGRFADPALLGGDFLALFAGGIALGLVRERSGHIGAAIGLHAAWVAGIKLTREFTELSSGSSFAWLVGRFDGVIGYQAAIWILVVVAVFVATERHGGIASHRSRNRPPE